MEAYLRKCKELEKDPPTSGYIDRILLYKRDGIWSSYEGITTSNEPKMLVNIALNDEDIVCNIVLDLLRSISITKANIILLSIYSPSILVFFGDLDSLRTSISAMNKPFIKTTIMPNIAPININSSSTYNFIAETNLPTHKGMFRVRSYRNYITNEEFIALIVGNIEHGEDILIRVHDQCATSETFGSLRCDCKEQLDSAMISIQKVGGMIIYLQQEGRGIGLANKIAAYAIQELGIDTVDANRVLGLPNDSRQYESAKYILDDLDIKSIKLITNNPSKVDRLTELGIKISTRIPCIVDHSCELSSHYVRTKVRRMGHLIPETDSSSSSYNKEL